MSLCPWRAYTASMMFGLFVTLRKSCLSSRGPASEFHYRAAHANLKANTLRCCHCHMSNGQGPIKPFGSPKDSKRACDCKCQPASKQRADLLNSSIVERPIEDVDFRNFKHWHGYYNVQGICDQSNPSLWKANSDTISTNTTQSESIAHFVNHKKVVDDIGTSSLV